MARKASKSSSKDRDPAESGDRLPINIDEYHFAIEESALKIPERTRAGLLELSIWPPRQGERGKRFPLWCDLRFAHLEEEYLQKWRLRVYLTRAELVADFIDCKPERGSLYGDNLLPSHEVASEREQEKTETSQKFDTSISASGETRGKFLLGLKGIFSQKKGRSSTFARSINTQVKHHRVSALPAAGSGKVWQIKDPRGSLDGTYLIAPSEDRGDAFPLCRVIPNSDQFELTLGLEVRSNDIGFEIKSMDSGLKGILDYWRRPNQRAIIKLLITKSFIERFDPANEGRLRVVSVRLTGTRRLDSEGRAQ